MSSFDPFVKRRTALLTTYKRDGTTVADAGDDRRRRRPRLRAHLGQRLEGEADAQQPGGARRARRPSAAARPARRSAPAAACSTATRRAHAARAIARRQPILQGVLVPLAHRLMRYRTLHYELTPTLPSDA